MEIEKLKSLLTSITEKIDKTSEHKSETNLFEKWYSLINPSLDSNQVSVLEEHLRTYPELNIFDNKMVVLETGAGRIDFNNLAKWLVNRASKVGVDEAVSDLLRYLSSDEFEYHQISALHRITVEKELQFFNGIKLIPFSDVPDSTNKRVLENIISYGFPIEPNSALIGTLTQRHIHISDSSELDVASTNYWRDDFDDAHLCLVLIGLHGNYSLGSWASASDWVPCGISSGLSMPTFTQVILGRKLLDSKDFERVIEVHKLFTELNSSVKEQLRICLSRLNSALLQSSNVDSAIDLRIALEGTFLNDIQDLREYRFRLGIRAARLLGRNLDERHNLYKLFRDLYDIGSKAVHEGRLSRVYNSRDTRSVLEEGFKYTAEAIIKIIGNNGFREEDWKEITLS